MRSLFLRIFLSLSTAVTLIFLAIVVTAVGSGKFPLTLPILTRAFLGDEIAASGANALSAYQVGGANMLSRYFIQLKGLNGTSAWLIGPDGREVLGQAVPDSVHEIAEKTTAFGLPVVELRRFQLLAAVKWERNGEPFTVAFSRNDMRAPRQQLLIPDVSRRYLPGLLAAIAFSYVLSRLIARPVEHLRQCMHHYSGGATALTLPAGLLVRKDELGDLAREFDQMKQRIEGLLQRQQQLIADISHELRSPLTRLSVAVEIARDSGEREPELLERMAREVSYLEALIQQLLRLASLEAGNRGGQHVVSLSDVLAAVVENSEFEATAVRRNICYQRTGTELFVEGDEFLLASALENILRNGIRYTPVDTAVMVNAAPSPDERYIVTTFRDHGPGIPADALSEVFRPFYRLGTARDRESGGAGLGLSIAQRSILVCNGSISAYNHPEGGLVVEVRLKKASARCQTMGTNPNIELGQTPDDKNL